MNTPILTADPVDFRQFVIWLVTILVVAFGFRFAKDAIAFLLENLYQFFIQNNPTTI